MDYPIDEMVTPGYWEARSSSKAYREAYKQLAKMIPERYSGAVIDIACGTGRLLECLYHRLNGGILVGTDISQEMLSIAFDRLSSKGIQVKLKNNAKEIDFRNPGVYLVKDHLLETYVPQGVSNYTFFTFPELGDDYTGKSEDIALLDQATQFFRLKLTDPILTKCYLTNFRADVNLGSMTKNKGRIISTHYAHAERGNSTWNAEYVEGMKKHAEFIGCELLECVFRESDGIWRDTISSRKNIVLVEGELKGYWTTVMRKL